MKKPKLLPLTGLLFLIAVTIHAQAPQLINYQAVVRTASGAIVQAGTPVQFVFTIHDSSATGPQVFTETQTDTVNQFGLAINIFLVPIKASNPPTIPIMAPRTAPFTKALPRASSTATNIST